MRMNQWNVTFHSIFYSLHVNGVQVSTECGLFLRSWKKYTMFAPRLYHCWWHPRVWDFVTLFGAMLRPNDSVVELLIKFHSFHAWKCCKIGLHFVSLSMRTFGSTTCIDVQTDNFYPSITSTSSHIRDVFNGPYSTFSILLCIMSSSATRITPFHHEDGSNQVMTRVFQRFTSQSCLYPFHTDYLCFQCVWFIL